MKLAVYSLKEFVNFLQIRSLQFKWKESQNDSHTSFLKAFLYPKFTTEDTCVDGESFVGINSDTEKTGVGLK